MATSSAVDNSTSTAERESSPDQRRVYHRTDRNQTTVAVFAAVGASSAAASRAQPSTFALRHWLDMNVLLTAETRGSRTLNSLRVRRAGALCFFRWPSSGFVSLFSRDATR